MELLLESLVVSLLDFLFFFDAVVLAKDVLLFAVGLHFDRDLAFVAGFEAKGLGEGSLVFSDHVDEPVGLVIAHSLHTKDLEHVHEVFGEGLGRGSGDEVVPQLLVHLQVVFLH